MSWLLWRKPGARFLIVDLWRLRLMFRVSPRWTRIKTVGPGYSGWMVDWWWKDDYQMHHWLSDEADRFGDRVYGT